MKCQVEKLVQFQHMLLLEFNRGAKTAEAARNICALYGDNAIRESMARKWFSHFKEDCFDIRDTPRSGRSSWFDEDRLNTVIHSDPRQCTRELANVMNCGPFHYHATFAFNRHGSKIGCMSTAYSKPKLQKSAGGHMAHFCLFGIDWLENNIEFSYSA